MPRQGRRRTKNQVNGGMPKRTTSKDFAKLVSRVGYGVEPAFKKRATNVETRNTGEINDLELSARTKLEDAERLQIGVSGKVLVRIRFYRHRLADYSRAISEKAWIDSAVYAGLLAGDSENEICLIDEGQFKVDKKTDERIEITFDYPEVDFDNLWVKRNRKDGR